MRKLSCIMLAIVLVLSVSSYALAASYESETDPITMYIPADQVVCVPCVEVTLSGRTAKSDVAYTEYIPHDRISSAQFNEPILETIDLSESLEAGNQITPYASYRLEFGGAMPNITFISDNDIVVSSGETVVLDVTTCVWAPEHYNISIGLWNAYTAEATLYTATDGDGSGTYRFRNMDAGTYRVCVINRGTTNLTTGYMLFNIS